MPDHGHLVADGNRHVYDHPHPTVPLKPGSGTRPFFGQEAEIVDEEGNPAPDEGGLLVQESMAGDARRSIETLTATLANIGQRTRAIHHRRLGQAGQGWLLLDHWPRGRCDQG